MFTIEFPEINPTEYNHSSYDPITNKRVDTLEITDKLVEKLKNYESINFYAYFDDSIDRLPDNIKSIRWRSCLSYSYNINKLPENLETLDISALSSKYNRNKNFKICKIPDTVKKLFLPNDMKILLENIPKSLEVLYINTQELSFDLQTELMNCVNLKELSVGANQGELSHNFNFEMLPDNLEFLQIRSNISSNLNNLPNKIKEIILFLPNINFQFDNLPSSLERLSVTSYPDKALNINLDFLPINLKVLEIATTQMDMTLINLPERLKFLNLTFEENINFNENWIIYPKGLKHLELHTNIMGNTLLNLENLKKLTERLPEGLVELEIDVMHFDPTNKLVDSIKYLKINNKNNNHLILWEDFVLPQELKYLNLDSNIVMKIKEFPNKLECLIIEDVEEELPKFPESLKTLYIGNYLINIPILYLPEHLEHFIMYSPNVSFNKAIPSLDLIPKLPKNLKSVFLECVFNKSLVLPPNLKALGIFPHYLDSDSKANEYVQNIFSNMPDSIEIFTTSVFVQLYKFDKLPKNLKELGIKNVNLNKFDFNKFFTDQGCNFDSSNITIFKLDENEDVLSFNNYIIEYFDQYDFEYSYN